MLYAEARMRLRFVFNSYRFVPSTMAGMGSTRGWRALRSGCCGPAWKVFVGSRELSGSLFGYKSRD